MRYSTVVMDFTAAVVGDRVYAIPQGAGTITAIGSKVDVGFDAGGSYKYDLAGKLDTADAGPSLFWGEPEMQVESVKPIDWLTIPAYTPVSVSRDGGSWKDALFLGQLASGRFVAMDTDRKSSDEYRRCKLR